jgi:Protein of unknown function (DUF2971)
MPIPTPPEIKDILAAYDPLQKPFDCTERLQTDPPLLAHYTSLHVAEQIIKNEEIWLSHPFYMNDLEELRFGMQQGIQHFPMYAQIAEPTPTRTKLLLDMFNHYIGHMTEKTLVDTYVLCLCEHAPDDTDGVLSMWRSYASQGHSIALVFNARYLPNSPQAPLRIAKVIYGTQPARVALLQAHLQEWANITSSARLADDRLFLAAYAAFRFIKSFALVTKHNGFEEEKEWRIIYDPEFDPDKRLVNQFSYFIGPRGAEPKLKFKIAPVPGGAFESLSLARLLEFIVLGPSLSSPIAKSGFSRVLRGTCLKDFEDRVHASTIPLRPTMG